MVVPMFSLCSHWLYSRGRGANLFRSYRPEVCRHTPRLKRVDVLTSSAALFAAWFTYGIAGFFWIHDTYYLHGGMRELKRRFMGTILALLTILAGAFICLAGTYVFVRVS